MRNSRGKASGGSLDEEAGSHGLGESAQGLMLSNLLINDQDTLNECMLTRLVGDPCAGGTASYGVTGWNSKYSQQG